MYISVKIRFLEMRSLTKFEVLMTVNINIAVSWDLTPCNLVGRYQRFAQTCYLHLPVQDLGPVPSLFISLLCSSSLSLSPT
jgi:hypothetical protein